MKNALHRCPTCNGATVPARPIRSQYIAKDGATDSVTHYRRRCTDSACGITSIVRVMTQFGLPPLEA